MDTKALKVDLVENKMLKEDESGKLISNISEIFNTYKWALCFIGINNSELLIDVKKHEADSKFFRSLIIAFLIIAFAILLKENNGILFVIFLILAF